MQKGTEVTYYFVTGLMAFFLASGSSFKASPVLTKPVGTWLLDNGSAEAHMCSRLSLPFDFHLPFWYDAWHLGCLTAQLLKLKASLICAAERCRGDHKSDAPFPAEHLALRLITEMEKHFKDLLWFCLSLTFILPRVFNQLPKCGNIL